MATMKRMLGLILGSTLSSADAGGCGGDGGGISDDDELPLLIAAWINLTAHGGARGKETETAVDQRSSFAL